MAGKPGFVTAWYVLGPFRSGCADGENVQFLDPKHTKYWEADLLKSAGGEENCRPRSGAVVRAQGLERKWKPVEVRYFHCLEIEKVSEQDSALKAWMQKETKSKWWNVYDSINYAAAYIYSSKAVDARVYAGGWDGYRLWVNGVFAGEDHTWHHQILDQDNYTVSLKKGLNLFLVKTDRSRLMLRLTDAGGLPLKGVYSVLPDATEKNTVLMGGETSSDPLNVLRKLAWTHRPKMQAPVPAGKAKILSWQKYFREELERIFLLKDRPRGRIQIKKISSEDKGEYIREKLEFRREGLFSRFTAFLLLPKKRNGAAMVALHGHGGDKTAVSTLPATPVRNSMNHEYGVHFAKRGYVTICIDAIGFAERETKGFDNCTCLNLGANLLGRDLFSWDLYDYMTLVDYLSARKDVDKKRIGCAGVSFGGTSAYMLAALDKRISACITSCAVTSFKEYLQEIGDSTCGSQSFYGIYKYGDISDVLSLIAPRPLFIEAGRLDYCFSVHFAEEAYTKIKKIYSVLGAPDKAGADFFLGGHKFNGERSFDWLDGNLS